MADTQYAIEIAAAMPAGEVTISQLEQLGAQLTGADKNATRFADQISKVTASLDAAKAASAAANAALATGNQRFAELERAALGAAKAAERAALKNGGVVPFEISARAAETAMAVDHYGDTLRALEGDAKRAVATEKGLAQALAQVQRASKGADDAISKQNQAAADAARAATQVEKKSVKEAEQMVPLVKNFRDLGDAMKTAEGQAILAIGAISAVGVAVAAVTIALVAGTLAIAAWAIGLGDAKRSAGLAHEAFEAMNPDLAGLGGVFKDVTAATGQGADSLRKLTKQLQAAKVPAADMAGALHAAALAETALGAGGSQEFIEQIKAGKVAVGALSDDVRNKLGPIVSKQLRGLDGQAEKFKKNIGDLFGGLNIEPVLAGLERLVGLFDKNTAAGQTIQAIFETVFQPLINNAEKAAIVIEAFALGFLIGLTKVYIAVKPAIKAVSEFFGFKDTSLTDVLGMVTKAGELVAPVFLVFVGVLGAVGIAIALAVAQIMIIPVALAAMVAAVVYAGVQVVKFIIDAWNSVTEFLNGLIPNFGDIASNIMQGLIGGILGAGPAFISALTGVVGSGIDAARKLLGIASPSKVFAEIGGQTAAGLAVGVEDGEAEAQSAMMSMVAPPKAPTAPTATAPGGGSKPAVHIENLYLNGAKASRADAESLAEMVTAIFEGDAASLGAEEAPA